MNVIQSFWSKPMFVGKNLHNVNWLDKRSFFFSCALSCLLLKKNFNSVNLITDQFGKDLLINKMNLPYTKIDVILDDLNKYPSTLWAIGKIFSYFVQVEPFMHVDFDFFIPFNKFDIGLTSSKLFCFSPENDIKIQNAVYKPALDKINNKFVILPNKYLLFKNSNYKLAYNAGIIGGSELDIFKELYKIVFEMLDLNMSALVDKYAFTYNVVLEQYLFACLAELNNIPVRCLIPESQRLKSDQYQSMKYFPNNSVHLLGSTKKDKLNCKFIEDIMYSEFNDYYRFLTYMLKHNII